MCGTLRLVFRDTGSRLLPQVPREGWSNVLRIVCAEWGTIKAETYRAEPPTVEETR